MQGRGLGAEPFVQQPPAVLQPAQVLAAHRVGRLEVQAMEGHDVPAVVRSEIEHRQLGSLPLHPEAEMTRRRSDLEHRPVLERDPAEIGGFRAAQVPVALDRSVRGHVDGVVEVAITDGQAGAGRGPPDV